MASSHFVAWLQTALDREIDLYHLQNACRQLVALGQLLALFFERKIETVPRLLEGVLDAVQLGGNIILGRTNVKPVKLLDRSQIGFVDFGSFWQLVRTAVCGFADQQFFNTVKGIGFHNAQLIVQVKAEALELIVNDLLGPTVTSDSFPGKHLNIDHGALRTLIYPQ